MAGRTDRRIPDAELEVLSCLHRRGEATARDIREDLWDQRPMAHGSVLTLLGRLEHRGLVARTARKVGKAHVYEPTRQRGVTVRPVLRRLVDRVFAGNPVDLVASLFETRPPTPSELEAIQHLVREARRNRERSR
jgi:BlaI family transcriptional regulator, penicillinase repressor